MRYPTIVVLLGVTALLVPLVTEAEEAALTIPICQNWNDDPFPYVAGTRPVQGRVLLDLVIDRKGRVTSMEVKDADADAALAPFAKKYWSKAKCKVSKDWAERGGESRHFLLNVSYVIYGAPHLPPLDPSSPEVVITNGRGG